MNLESDEFIAGAIAASKSDLEIVVIASGNMESAIYKWYLVRDAYSNQCIIALDDGDSGSLPEIEKCLSCEKRDVTKAMLRTLNFGADIPEVETEAWLCVLSEGWVDTDWVDESILRETLEAGASILESEFNFDVWLSKIRPRKYLLGKHINPQNSVVQRDG
ncbi:MAG: hypothetical protein ACK5JP_05215 [Akkermansiaceae bacterium]|jgi:hypothetical protein